MAKRDICQQHAGYLKKSYIANYVKDFISYEQHREAQRNRKFVEDQKSDAKIQFELSEELLTSFRKKHPIPRDTPELQMQRSRLESGIEENRAVYITIRQQYEIAKIEESRGAITKYYSSSTKLLDFTLPLDFDENYSKLISKTSSKLGKIISPILKNFSKTRKIQQINYNNYIIMEIINRAVTNLLEKK